VSDSLRCHHAALLVLRLLGSARCAGMSCGSAGPAQAIDVLVTSSF
jgi:hypothetical protein